MPLVVQPWALVPLTPECGTRRRPDHRFTLQGRMKGRSTSVGTCVAYGRAYVCKTKRNIQTLTVQTRVLQLDGGNKMSDCVFEIDFAVQIRLPIDIQQPDVLPHSAWRESLPKLAEYEGHIHLPGKNHVTRLRIRPGLLHHGAKDFAGGVINQGGPEIAGNGLVSLAAFARDGVFHVDTDALGGVVDELLHGFRGLIALLSA